MTFDKIVFVYQILWIKTQLTNKVKPKNYPNFTQLVSNSNAFSTNNNIFVVRGYITPQFLEAGKIWDFFGLEFLNFFQLLFKNLYLVGLFIKIINFLIFHQRFQLFFFGKYS